MVLEFWSYHRPPRCIWLLVDHIFRLAMGHLRSSTAQKYSGTAPIRPSEEQSDAIYHRVSFRHSLMKETLLMF